MRYVPFRATTQGGTVKRKEPWQPDLGLGGAPSTPSGSLASSGRCLRGTSVLLEALSTHSPVVMAHGFPRMMDVSYPRVRAASQAPPGSALCFQDTIFSIYMSVFSIRIQALWGQGFSSALFIAIDPAPRYILSTY